MKLIDVSPKHALNKAYRKVKPNREDIERFKQNFATLLDRINDFESEEFHKNLVIEFLKKTYYDPDHFVNTKGRNDLVIHNGANASSTVGVIIEAKKPTNKAEMITKTKVNVKAFQELVLYYLRERLIYKNIEIKYLIATNINEWFIFDATLFDRLFAQNRLLTKQFIDFEQGRLADTKTDFFYKHIAEPFVENISLDLECTYFKIDDFQKNLRSRSHQGDTSLIALYKLLSPEHLLKLPFSNDSNTLDKRFYSELLYIIGLKETKDGSKKIITRNESADRNTGTILEDTIIQLDSLDKLSRIENLVGSIKTKESQLFDVALELTITWINRILFLKLLEAQLIRYHKGDKSYSFLNLTKIKTYDDLNDLFFQVLARKYDERNKDVKAAYEKVPYLNSSLFEPTNIEQLTLFISNLKNDKVIPVAPQTVLKDRQGRKRSGNIPSLEYLFEFLNAYDFSSEGSEEIQEEKKILINASVLGLIFEKINGYKEGSFYTPGFITMYMAREVIRTAIVQKFNEFCKTNGMTHTGFQRIDEIYRLIPQIITRKKANEIVNSLKICDPAVGSGHFLVSALNEIIAIKNDLKILEDKEGRSLHRYEVQVANDELVVTDEDGDLFEYIPGNKESQRIQETLFHEKQTIIESCLFGVDINTNSVKICRLRLWIELLKNAYYKNTYELETLPNIDINIKCGNSLISRFDKTSDIKQALRKSKWTIESYRAAVDTYRNARNKEQKREMERLISDIKSDFRSEISKNDPKVKKLYTLNGELTKLTTQHSLFEIPRKDKATWQKKVNKLTAESKKLEIEIEKIKSNKVFENAFEWRFEFPEILNENGDFSGFDVVIGNPPYGMIETAKEFYSKVYLTAEGRFDLFEAFIEKGLSLVKPHGLLKYILPNTVLTNLFSKKVRQNLIEKYFIFEISNFGMDVFDEATVHTCILGIKNNQETGLTKIRRQVWKKEELEIAPSEIDIRQILESKTFAIRVTLSPAEINLFRKVANLRSLGDLCYIRQCIKTGNDSEYVKKTSAQPHEPWKKALRGKGINRYSVVEHDLYLKYGDFLARNWQNKSFYETPKIAVRETGNQIIATLDLENRYFLSTLYAIYPKEKSTLTFVKTLLGWLNSRFATFYLKKIAFDITDGAFTKVRTNQLAQLPIPPLEPFEEIISDIVDKIILAKGNELNADTASLENAINQYIYQAYKLADDEIAIVERSYYGDETTRGDIGLIKTVDSEIN